MCTNCGVPCSEMHSEMCNTCYLYWKRTGAHRPLTGAFRRGDRHSMGLLRQRKEPPKGMYLNHDDLNTLAESPPQAENVTLKELEKKVLCQKYRVQTKKQEIEKLKGQLEPCFMEKCKMMIEKSPSSPAAE